MAKQKKVSEAYLQELMKKVQAQEKKDQYRIIVKAGKELALLCLWLKWMIRGSKMSIENDIPAYLAQYFEKYPEELKVILGYYEDIKDLDVSRCFQGFTSRISDGELLVHFLWKPVELTKSYKK